MTDEIIILPGQVFDKDAKIAELEKIIGQLMRRHKQLEQSAVQPRIQPNEGELIRAKALIREALMSLDSIRK